MLQRTVAILGGSFDPPHYAHLEVARKVREVVDEVWVVPCGYRDDKPSLNSYDLRLEMCKRAFVDFNVSEYEKGKPMIPTYLLMTGLAKDYNHLNFLFIIGTDLLETLHTWDCAKELTEEIQFLVVNRGGVAISDRIKDLYLSRKNFQVFESNMQIEMSSTYIRRIVGSVINENISNEFKVNRINEAVQIQSVSEFIVEKGLNSSSNIPSSQIT